MDHRKIYFKSTGNGHPLVLLHGFLESMEIWNDFVEVLKQQFNVITIDLPGHGRTENFGGEHSMEMMAGVVKEVLDSLSINKCVIAGHSMGGYVSLAFARKYPEMMKGLVLFHSHARADSPPAKKNRERTIEAVRKNHTGFIHNFIPSLFAKDNVSGFSVEIEKLRNRSASTSRKGIIAALEGMKSRESGLSVLTEIDAPVLFIAGKKDARIPVDTVIEQAVLPAHSEMLILEGVGHMGYIEASHVTLSAVRSFAERAYDTK